MATLESRIVTPVTLNWESERALIDRHITKVLAKGGKLLEKKKVQRIDLRVVVTC